MPRFVIVGDRGSGKTTFLALLYAAQVKSGSARADAFRFHAAYESLEEISEAFQQVMSGSFPDSVAKEGLREVAYQLGYRHAGRGVLRRLRSKPWTPSTSTTLRLLVLRDLDEEMARYRKGSSFARVALRDVLESDGVVILVDSTKLGAMGRYDAAVESLLAALQRSRLRGGDQALHPIFIFTKFDGVDPASLQAAGVGTSPPGVGKDGPRRSYAEALLEKNLPKSLERLRSRDPQARPFARPSFFFSAVHNEPATAGRAAKIRLRSTAGSGWEPDYSQDEYLALLELFSKIAAAAGT